MKSKNMGNMLAQRARLMAATSDTGLAAQQSKWAKLGINPVHLTKRSKKKIFSNHM